MDKIKLSKNGIIGRGDESDYKLLHISISRKHCEITILGNTIRILDLGSKNGTYVNEKSIKEAILKKGDKVRLGNLLFTFDIQDSEFFLIPYQDWEFTPELESNKKISIQDLCTPPPIPIKKIDKAKSEALKEEQEATQPCELNIQMQKYELKIILDRLREKLNCQAIFLYEFFQNNKIIIEKSTEGKYIINTNALNAIKQRILASKIIKSSIEAHTGEIAFSDSGHLQKLWGPKEIPQINISINEIHENSIFCTPILIKSDKEIILYVYWSNGCLTPKIAEKIIEYEGKTIAEIIKKQEEEKTEEVIPEEILKLLKEKIIYSSPYYSEIIKKIIKISNSKFSILLIGPRGSGKSTLANLIHKISNRRNYPFKEFNCLNFLPNIIEEELLSFKKENIINNIKNSNPLLESNGGTFFIKSIEYIPVEVQFRFSKIIKEMTIKLPYYDKEEILDIRFLGAVSEDPITLLEKNRLDPNFLNNIAEQTIYIPSLWERPEDIEALAYFLIEKEKKQIQKPLKLKGFTDDALKALKSYLWPENVKQLCYVIDQLLITVDKELATDEDIINAIFVTERTQPYKLT